MLEQFLFCQVRLSGLEQEQAVYQPTLCKSRLIGIEFLQLVQGFRVRGLADEQACIAQTQLCWHRALHGLLKQWENIVRCRVGQAQGQDQRA